MTKRSLNHGPILTGNDCDHSDVFKGFWSVWAIVVFNWLFASQSTGLVGVVLFRVMMSFLQFSFLLVFEVQNCIVPPMTHYYCFIFFQLSTEIAVLVIDHVV